MLKSMGGFARGGKSNQAFTLVELSLATALLRLRTGSARCPSTEVINFAWIARFYTGAKTGARNRIDLILPESPSVPHTIQPQVPLPFTLGTSAQTLALYGEPCGAGDQTHTVTRQMVTTVGSNNFLTEGKNLNLYSVPVVTHTYRRKDSRVPLNAMRASDL